jgi:hypothetical protein
MTSRPATTPIAEIHAPEELLDGAEILFASANPKMMRAAVLEAITALEAFVQDVVFTALQGKLDPLLVQWLEEKTKMDFDSRLSILTPIAVGRPIAKQSSLWKSYKDAKEIRNKVTHSGRKVSADEARFVIDTVYNWLTYLGSTIELEVALLGLKRHVEQEAKASIESERDAVSLISQYFGRTKAASNLTEVSAPKRSIRADVILKFGQYTVLVETKFSRGRATQNIVEGAIKQASKLMHEFEIDQSAVIIFQKGELQKGYEAVHQYLDGKMYVVVIKV